jgi:hypothetical protein
MRLLLLLLAGGLPLAPAGCRGQRGQPPPEPSSWTGVHFALTRGQVSLLHPGIRKEWHPRVGLLRGSPPTLVRLPLPGLEGPRVLGWSADDRWLAIAAADGSGAYGIYVLRAPDATPIRLAPEAKLTRAGDGDYFSRPPTAGYEYFSWAPGGSLYWVRDTGRGVVVGDATEADVRYVGEACGFPRWNSDGSGLAWPLRSGQFAVLDAGAPQPRVIALYSEAFAWPPGGRPLLLSHANGRYSVVDLAKGTTVEVADECWGVYGRQIDEVTRWSPDGQFVALAGRCNRAAGDRQGVTQAPGAARLILHDTQEGRTKAIDMGSGFRILTWLPDSSGIVCERSGKGVWLVPTEDAEPGLRRLTEGAPDPLWPTLQHHIAVRTPSKGVAALDLRTLNVLPFPAPAAEHEREGGLGEVGFSPDESLALVSWTKPGATTEGASPPGLYHTQLYLWQLDAAKASPIHVDLDGEGQPEFFRAGSFQWSPDGEFVLLRYTIASPWAGMAVCHWGTLDPGTGSLTTIVTEDAGTRWVAGPKLQ